MGLRDIGKCRLERGTLSLPVSRKREWAIADPSLTHLSALACDTSAAVLEPTTAEKTIATAVVAIEGHIAAKKNGSELWLRDVSLYEVVPIF